MPRRDFTLPLRVEPDPEPPGTPFDPPVETPDPPVLDPGTAVADVVAKPSRPSPGVGRFVRFEKLAEGGAVESWEEWHQTGAETVEAEPGGESVDLLVFTVKFLGRDPASFGLDAENPIPPLVELTKTVRRRKDSWERRAALRAGWQVSEADSP